MEDKSKPIITVRLVGVKPELVPLGSMSELIGAVQSLIGPDLCLLKIKRTSAAYQLSSESSPGPIVAKVKNCARAFKTPDTHLQSSMLNSFDTITRILKKLDCYMQVFSPDEKWRWQVKQDEWDGIRERYLIEDEAVLIGELKRIGGASHNKCTIRVPFQKELVYCQIEHPDVARKLGPYLYSEVELKGRGKFFTRDWKLLNFRVTDFTVRKPKSWEQHYREVREVAGKAWDNIADPNAFIEEMR